MAGNRATIAAAATTDRRREHDRQVLNSLVYRLKTGVRYRDIPRSDDYARSGPLGPSTGAGIVTLT